MKQTLRTGDVYVITDSGCTIFVVLGYIPRHEASVGFFARTLIAAYCDDACKQYPCLMHGHANPLSSKTYLKLI